MKNAFIILSTEYGQYPNIDEDNFTEFCSQNNIFDHLFTKKHMAEVFKETNIEYIEDEDDNNPDDLLNRSEFLEIWMRIAEKKYKSTIEMHIQDE